MRMRCRSETLSVSGELRVLLDDISAGIIWAIMGALSCLRADKDTDSPFVLCRKEGDYADRVIALPGWTRDKGEGLADKPNLE